MRKLRSEKKHVTPKHAARSVQETKSPGQVSDKLRRKMGDALADIFSEAGVKLYSDAVLEMKGSLEKIVKDVIGNLEGTIKEELGKRGVGHAAELFKPWITEVVSEVITSGLEEIRGGLEDLASDAAAEFSVKPDEEEGDEELLGMEGEEDAPTEEVDTVEEEPVAEPAASDTGVGEGVIPEAPAAGTEDLLEGLDMGGGEAGANFASDPYAPRTWRKKNTTRKVATVLALTPEHLVNWSGGLDAAKKKAKTLSAAVALLQRVQRVEIQKLALRSAKVAIREVEPLVLLDYASKFWSHR